MLCIVQAQIVRQHVIRYNVALTRTLTLGGEFKFASAFFYLFCSLLRSLCASTRNLTRDNLV